MADKKISELEELTTPSSTDVLPISHGEDTYKVKVQNLVPPSSSSLEDLEDVEITTPSDGDSLVYNEDDDKWKSQMIIKEVTQAEYDALVQAGTVDPNTAYFIKDTNGDGSQFQPVIYSLEEREIGVWTDGKPLYEKTFVIDASSITFATENVINHNISDIDEIIKADGFINMDWQQYGGGGEPIFNTGLDGNINSFTPSYATCLKDINGTSFTVVIGNGRLSQGVKNAVVILRYTKTTDTAGSGTWTPQGVPAVHYSTDEQVVGTWIDGSPIYSKVFDLGSELTVSNSSWTSTNITGISQTINAFGIGGAGSQYPLMSRVVNNTVDLLACRDNANAYCYYICLCYTKSSS